MKRASKLEKVNPLALKVSREVNFRDDYNLTPLVEDIRVAGRILEPLHVERETNIVLKGNRRAASAQVILSDANCPPELKKNLENTEVIYYTDLTEKERTQLVLDHGSQQTLSRVETIKAVWRLSKQGWSEAEIGCTMYQLLAKFTGKTKKLAEVEALPEGPARDEKLKTWFHGTLGNIILAVGGMGERVKDQYILNETKSDRKLTEAEEARIEFEMKNSRIQALTSAKKKDKDGKSGAGWTPQDGGEFFNEQIAKFIEEDANGGPDTTKRFTPKQMEDTADKMSSRMNLAFLQCAGKLTEAQARDLDSVDTEYARRDKVFSILTQNVEKLERLPQELVRAILYGNPDDLSEVLSKFVVVEAKVA